VCVNLPGVGTEVAELLGGEDEDYPKDVGRKMALVVKYFCPSGRFTGLRNFRHSSSILSG
jgi:hypothetical protein